MNIQQQQEAQKRLDECLDALGEFYDCIQVLVSTVADNGTTYRKYDGRGNWFARTGMAAEFLEQDRQRETAIHIANAINREDE